MLTASAGVMAVQEYSAVDVVDVSNAKMSNSVGYDDMSSVKDENMENNGTGLSTHVILYIVIGVCAVLGIVLGIFRGRKAAYK